MTEAEKAAVRARIAAWERAGPVMQKLRDEETRAADTQEAIEAFSGLFVDAVSRCPPAPTSGLIEQQRWFRKLAERGP